MNDSRMASSDYGPRYGPFSIYAPEPQPTTYYSGHARGGPDEGQGCDTPAGWDPHAVLRRYRGTAAAKGAGWALDTDDHAEEAS